MDFVSFFNAVKPPYEIEQSLRFDGGSKLERTNSDNGDSRSFTLSYWIKKTYLGDNNNSIVGTNDGASNWSYISYGESSSDPDQLLARSSGSGSGYSNAYVFNAQRKHRDPSAWQHHFLVVDKTAGTSKGYINGVLDEGDGGYGGTRSSNGWTLNGTTATVRIGAHSQTGTSNYLNGYLADWYFVDGTAMDVTDFGGFDDYGVWRPIEPTISSFGTNGYYLKFDPSASNGVGHDHSGNGNNWTATGFNTLEGNGQYSQHGDNSTTNPSYIWQKAFNGVTNNLVDGAQPPDTNGASTTWDTDSPIAFTKLEVLVGAQTNSNGYLTVNGTTIATGTFTKDNVVRAYDITSSVTSPLDTITVHKAFSVSNNNGLWLNGVRINDELLVDYSAAQENDVKSDTPTTNWCTLNPLDKYNNSAVVAQNGNLEFAQGGAAWWAMRASFGVTSGKWYWEVKNKSGLYQAPGLGNSDADLNGYASEPDTWLYVNTGQLNTDGTLNSAASWGGNSHTTNDIIGVAFDADSGKLWFSKNGTWQGDASPNPATDTDPAVTGLTNGPYFPYFVQYQTTTEVNFGQRDFSYTPPTGFKALNTANLPAPTIKGGSENFSANTWTGNGTTNNALTGFGHQPDFVWGKARNQAYAHALFDSVRGGGYRVYNTGTTPPAQDYLAEYIKSFDSDGITLGSDGNLNGNNVTYAGWSWKGGGNTGKTYTVKVVSDSGNKYRFDDFGTSAVTLSLAEGGTYVFDQSDSSNSGHPLRFSTTSDGTHNSGSEYTTGVTVTGTPGQAGAKTTIVVAASAPTLYYYCSVHSGMGGQADTTTTLGSSNFDGSIATVANPNPTGGFSVIKYTSNGTSGATIGHGLGVAPAFFIVKNIDATDHYSTYHQSLGNTKALLLNSANAPYTATAFWNNTSPTSSVITLGNETSTNNSDSDDYICWAWAEVEGYSKFGSYSGGDGVFVYLGFKPSLLILKGTVGTRNWIILDSERSTYNVVDDVIHPNLANSESVQGSSSVDFVSNGFVTRGGNISGSGDLTVFAAFAENPFGGDGVSPATAR